jgi:GNAT superfamily N-acetyltransferase
MIEIRTFDGEPGELSAFTVRVWRQAYEGRMLMPLWSAAFFRRELFPADDRCRPYLIAAYDGTRLVGSHPSRPLRIRLHGQEIPATWGSFISVDPEYRRRGVALKLQHEWDRRHRLHGARVNLGFQYVRSPVALGPKFWLHQPERIPIIRKLGLWVRALDHAAVADFGLDRLEAWGARLLSLVQRAAHPPANMDGIRLYRPEDLDACLRLVDLAGQSADLAYLWEPPSLQQQLCCAGVSETVVLDREGRAAGLVNYTLQDILGRFPLTVALIDIIAFGSLAATDRRRLLSATLARMAATGVKAAMLLRGSSYGWQELLAAGFLPMPADHYFIGATFGNHVNLEGVRRLQVLLR